MGRHLPNVPMQATGWQLLCGILKNLRKSHCRLRVAKCFLAVMATHFQPFPYQTALHVYPYKMDPECLYRQPLIAGNKTRRRRRRRYSAV